MISANFLRLIENSLKISAYKCGEGGAYPRKHRAQQWAPNPHTPPPPPKGGIPGRTDWCFWKGCLSVDGSLHDSYVVLHKQLPASCLPLHEGGGLIHQTFFFCHGAFKEHVVNRPISTCATISHTNVTTRGVKTHLLGTGVQRSNLQGELHKTKQCE